MYTQVQKEWLNYDNTGMGFVEISHRDAGGPVQNVMVDTQRRVRELLQVPDTHHVLFMHGGAHQQFSAVPVNLTRGRDGTGAKATHGQYVDTGYWGSRSASVAHNWMRAYLPPGAAPETVDGLFCGTERGFLRHESAWDVAAEADYVYFCMNETIAGLEYKWDPTITARDAGGRAPPLVCDATSTLLSRPVDISKYGLIFASSGKNLGPAGLCLVIVHDKLLRRGDERFLDGLPMLDYAQQATSEPVQNLYNTPPTFNIYMLNKVLAEYQAQGGLEAMEAKAEDLSAACYCAIDASPGFYEPEVDLLDNDRLAAEYAHGIRVRGAADDARRVVAGLTNPRSRMNVCFRIGGRAEAIGQEARGHNMALEREFTRQAAEHCGIVQLKGHPLFGGLRITLYNQIEREAVDAVLQFMDWFEHENKEKVAR